MSLIKNLINEAVKKPKKSDNDSNDEDEKEERVRPIIKSATDLQRLKLEKLMRNPEKPVVIPEQRKEKDYMQSVPSFVRNVMGSSAGAGSGEFHVYRHLRRKEYARQKNIQALSVREQMDEEFHKKLEDNRRIAEEKTAQKRAKRLKKKERAKRARKSGIKKEQMQTANDENTDSSEAEEDNDHKGEDSANVTEIVEEHTENILPEEGGENISKDVDSRKEKATDKDDVKSNEESLGQQEPNDKIKQDISNLDPSTKINIEEPLNSAQATAVDGE